MFLTSQRMPSRYNAYTCIYNYVNIYTPSVASGSQSTSTTHFSFRRNIVGRLCIRPTIVFLILSNQKARVRSITSRRLGYRYIHDCEWWHLEINKHCIIDQFFYGWGRNLRFRNRTRKKVYRRQIGIMEWINLKNLPS